MTPTMMEHNDVKVCAIIPAYNEGRHIADVVRGVKAQDVIPVVIDDCSGDDTVKVARSVLKLFGYEGSELDIAVMS